MKKLIVPILVAVTGCAIPAIAQPLAARSLFAVHGGVGVVPVPTPPGTVLHEAVVVVEVSSTQRLRGVRVESLTVVSSRVSSPGRSVQVERFERPAGRTEGRWAAWAYYLNPSGTRPFNGEVPPGTHRLRFRAAFDDARAFRQPHLRYRLILVDSAGRRIVVEGSFEGEWAT